MSPRQLVYEGTDLQELIQRVLDEHGPARIRPPERRKKGGLFGLFAREVYVISVDPMPVATAANPGAPGAGPVLPASANGTNGNGHVTANASPVNGSTANGSTANGRTANGSPATGNGNGNGIGHVTATGIPANGHRQVNGHGGAASSPAPVASDGAGGRPPLHAAPPDNPSGQVLSGVTSPLGEEPGTYRADPGVLHHVASGSSPASDGARDEAPGTGARPFSTVAEEPAPAPKEPAPAPKATSPDGPPAGPLEPEPAPEPVQLSLIDTDDAGRPELSAAIIDLLLATGFPETLVPHDLPLESGRSTLEAIFASLPPSPPLPDTSGGLVAVVGGAGVARSTARAVAADVGCPDAEVAVVSPGAGERQAKAEYRARTPRQAASMASGWRRDRVGVVAVYAPPLGTDQQWTRQVLRAIRPSCVWGMVTATTKPDDIRRWVTAIGGVDALVVTDVATTATPASIVSLGIPVVRLDDAPASPQRWAAVVADLVTKH